MSKIEDKSIELIEGLEKLTAQYAPDVADAALALTTINGMGNIVFGLFSAVAVFVMYKLIIKLVHISRNTRDDNTEILCILGAITLGVGFIIFFIVAMAKLTNIWNYVAIFEPKLALAYQVFKGVF